MVYVPPVRVVPERLVRLPLIAKISPLPTVRTPLFVKAPDVVKLRSGPSVNEPPAALIAKFASAGAALVNDV